MAVVKRNSKKSYTATKLAYNIGRLHGLRLRIFLYRKIGMQIGSNCVIRRGVYLASPNESSVGDGTFVGRANLYCTGGVRIGKNVNISDGVWIITAKHDIESANFEANYEPINIEDYAWLASNCMVLGGVTIGRGAIVAGGCVVPKDCTTFCHYGRESCEDNRRTQE